MNDWNGNGRYDSADSYMDYKLANSYGTSRPSSDWWVMPLLYIISAVFPPIGVIVVLIALIIGK